MKEEKKILLIHKVLTCQASKEELMDFDVLKNKSIKDSNLVDDISFLWENSKKDDSSIRKFNKANAKAKLFASIDESIAKNTKVSDPKVRRIGLRRLMSVAAAIVLLVASIVIFKNFDFDSVKSDSVLSSIDVISKDEESSVKVYKLSDNTEVWADKNAQLTIEVDHNAERRVVRLKGDAFFEIAKDKEHPFIVNVEGFEIEVLGTSFQVTTEEDGLEVDVFTGTVKFSKRNSEKIVLTKGMGAFYNYSKKEFEKIEKKNFKINTKDSYLIFNNTSLNKVFDRLSIYFGVKITSDCNEINSMRGFTSPQFAGYNINDYFSIIKKLYGLSFVETKKGEYKVTCD